ncbi:MAG: hypothetical protein HY512_03985 [Candidatus Aenigmarchaeota archaeon]|nr:hypothetical protein [Candidatus Aenigmarchaeota archaeon]
MPPKILNFFQTHKIITLLFLLTLVLWSWQHTTGFTWDFAAYSLNAEYIFGGGDYSEILRPPLASVLMFPAGLNRALGEYFYIILVSLIFLYSALKLADSLKLDRTAFYVFSLTPFHIFFGLFAGTELLSLSLLYLSVYSLYTKKSGILLGLLSLARYTNIFYLPIVLFQKNLKRIVLSLILFVAVFTPWFAYNYVMTGDPLTSLSDFYTLSIKYRDYTVIQPPKIEDILLTLNFTIPFLILGIYIRAKKGLGKTDILMIVILVLTLISYWRIPIKDIRYLFHLALPAAYFSMFALKKINFRYTVQIILVISLVSMAVLTPMMKLPDPIDFKEIAVKVNCSTMSNVWVPLSYYGLPTIPSPREQQINQKVEQGYRIVVYHGEERDITDPDQISKLPIIENNPKYLIIGDSTKCKTITRADYRYLNWLNDFLNYTYNYIVPTDPIGVFFGKE